MALMDVVPEELPGFSLLGLDMGPMTWRSCNVGNVENKRGRV